MYALLKTWIPPITVSMLMHVVVLSLLWYQFKHNDTHFEQPFIAVELLSNIAVDPAPKQTVRQPTPTELQPTVTQQASEMPAVTEKPAESSSAQTPVQPVPAQQVFQPISKLTKPPAFLQKIEPIYPAAEQRSGTQAYVLAEIMLDVSGKLQNINIVKSAGTYFDQAVIDAIKQSSFSPGYIEQNPVPVKVLVPFRFKLK